MPLKQQLAAYYRAAATRGRTLLCGATTPWFKERLGAEIGRCEQMAEEIERAPDSGANPALAQAASSGETPGR